MGNNFNIDLSKLKPIQSGHVFISLDKKYEDLLSLFPETLERIKMSLHFVQRMGFQDNNIKRVEGYFRAALCEFVSMEETLERETKKKCLKIFDTKHPLLILLKLLRNLEIHLCTRKISEVPRTFLWGSPQQEIELNIFNIYQIHIDELKALQGYKKFQDDEESLIATLDWFHNAVNQWGIVEIIIVGIHEYISEIEDILNSQNTDEGKA